MEFETTTNEIRWDKINEVFTAFASDLRWDKVPVRVKLRSTKTGRELVFQLTAAETNGDTDVVAWRYRADDGATVFNMTIFND